MLYINQLREDETIEEHYLCVAKQSLKSRAGKTYYSLRLQDKTGTVDAKIWDLNDGIDHFEAGDYIKVRAVVVTFQSALQLNVRRVRKSNEGEYSPEDYVPTTKYNIEEMWTELLTYVHQIENTYIRQLVEKFFVEDKEFIKRFKIHTAAKTMHHNFYGGLLEHTLGILRTCNFLANSYEDINRDMLFAGALFHDIGKTSELSEFPMIEYTDSGQLIGHIVIGVEWINEKINEIDGFPVHIANQVKHMVLAHHGELEYGSPKKPALLEAVVLHYVDNIDAKIKTFTDVIAAGEEGSDWLGYQRSFESNIRRTVL